MTSPRKNLDAGEPALGPLQKAIVALDGMKAKLQAMERDKSEPIAIIGMACRFPGGANSPEAFYNMLLNGYDAVSEVPATRWSVDAEQSSFHENDNQRKAVRWGAFLAEDPSLFDAAFFGISPREAAHLDPQQRLLLEVTWEALENAGQDSTRLAGTNVGVFLGAMWFDYAQLCAEAGIEDIYVATGNAHSFPPGRIAFTFGFLGPAIAIDTACSSSLVAVHLACQSLRNGESSLAVAGGVNLMLSPATTRLTATTNGLSPDGRCKTFDASANGFVRGEGCGIVVLKRLSDAQRDKDPILALIRGSAVNQDGRSTGLTTPNVLSQKAMLQRALVQAKLSASDIGYVEMHGTGTPLGDPIEAEALCDILGKPRADDSKCILGAVKTNVGHLEGAAGIAGLMKAVLSVQNEAIPPNIHFRDLNPRVYLHDTPFVFPTETVPWPRVNTPRRAGVSSFGMSGTNAHVILEEPPPELPRTHTTGASVQLLVLSAKSTATLTSLAERFAEWFLQPKNAALPDIAYTASLRRTHHQHRLAVIATSHEEFAQKLSAFARRDMPREVVQGVAQSGQRLRILFVFSGQGSQWAEMGARLLAEEPVFLAKIQEVDALVRQYAPFSVLEELRKPGDTSRLDETEIAQPALFALQIALVQLFEHWGIVPNAVVGHSVGEIAAAYVSGALSLDSAVRLVVLRGQLMQKAPGNGKMVWLVLPADEARRTLVGFEDKLAIAAINDPSSVVLSGESAPLDALVGVLEKRGIATRPLRVNYAFHSPQMELPAKELEALLGQFGAQDGTIPYYSTVTGTSLQGQSLTARYWARNVRETVNFAAAIRAALDDQYRILVEIGPHPVLLANLQQCAAAQNTEVRTLCSLRRHEDGRRALLEAVGTLHAEGLGIDWKKFHPHEGNVISLPNYPWRRERHWLEIPKSRRTDKRDVGENPLLGRGITSATQSELHLWECLVRAEDPPYLAEHCVDGEVVFPGAGYVEMAVAAASQVFGAGAVCLEKISFEKMLVLARDDCRVVQISLLEEGGGRGEITISSREFAGKDWIRHARGSVYTTASVTPDQNNENTTDKTRFSTTITGNEHYALMQTRGLTYGPPFQGVAEIRHGKNEALARIRLPDEIMNELNQYVLHPGILDASFQGAAWALLPSVPTATMVPIRALGIRIYQRPPREFWVYGQVVQDADNGTTLRLIARDDADRLLFEVERLRLQALDEKQVITDPFQHCIFEIKWHKHELSTSPPSTTTEPGSWLVAHDRQGSGIALANHLRAAGNRVVDVTLGTGYQRLDMDRYCIDPTNPQQWDVVLASAFGKIGCRCAIYCGALDGVTWRETSIATLTADLRRGPYSVLRLAQALLKQGWRDAPRLCLLTRAAQAVSRLEDRISIAQSTLWGLGRAIAMEQPDLGCLRIDLPAEVSPGEPAFIMNELNNGDGEDQVAMRPDGRYVARFVQGSWEKDTAIAHRREPAAGRPYRLEIDEPGVLERLVLHPIDRCIPGPGEVEIEIHAAGLNFLDVMKAMGIYPGMDRSSIQLGGECAGTVVGVGEGVTHLHVGQAVIASAPACFSSHLTTRVEFVTPKPENLSFEHAATIPAVHMTVHWALHHVAQLQRGERILIHSATGGTGLAAIQYANAVGAEIFATAGNEEKRAFLRSLGIANVMDSRSTAFADEILAKTKGRGVDVVLNSLTGEALIRSLDVLAPYGRFLEIGKKDIYQNTRVGLLPFRKSLSYTAIDLAGMIQDRPEQYGALLQEVVAKFERKDLEPSRVTVFSVNDSDSAFRLMAQAKHIGKIAIKMRDPSAMLTVSDATGTSIRGDATYLITGGLGGLGLSLASWMVRQGARSVALMGRGAPSHDALAAINEMHRMGATVRILRGNVAVAEDVDAIMAQLGRDAPPLRGVVHAAGVIADRTLVEMTEDDFFRPLEPKVFGAWNLHQATKGLMLDFFIMYSSSAGVLGSPGQANYACANTFLDGLCHARAAQNLPATSIQWGAFSDVGMAAAGEARGKRLSARGSDSFTPDDGTALFARILAQPRTEVALVRFDLRRWVEFYPQTAGMPFFTDLLRSDANSHRPGNEDFRDTLIAAAPADRSKLVTTLLLEHLGKVLRQEPSTIDTQTPFTNLGLDSLTSLEMRNRLETSLGLKLSAALLFTYPTISTLTYYLVGQLLPVQPKDETTSGGSSDHASGGFVMDHFDDTREVHDEDSTLFEKLGEFEEFLK